jgi:hypothetical protein
MKLRRENKTHSGDGADDVLTPSWKFYTEMSFLLTCPEARQSTSNLNNEEGTEIDSQDVSL